MSLRPCRAGQRPARPRRYDAGAALADYEGRIDSTTLAPGEKATGLVCGKGKWTPKVIAMTNPLFSEAARAQVA